MCGHPPGPSPQPGPIRLDAAHASLFFDPDAVPVLRVDPGSEVCVDTLDCTGGLIASPDDLIPDMRALIERIGGLNYVTGPIYVREARRGDVLRVTLLDIEPAPTTGEGFIAVAPGFGALVHDNGMGVQPSLPPATTICTVTRDEVVLPFHSGEVRLPCRPFVGTIGVAPARERRASLSQSPDHIGDIDLPQFRAGATLHVRANHDGGLLSLGDVHAAQGDGELGGIAVEVEARVSLHVDFVPRVEASMASLPLLVDADRVGVIAAFQGTATDWCARAAAVELANLLVRCGMRMEEALQYLSAEARIRAGNMFEPFYSAYVYLERESLPVELPPDI